MSVKRYDVGRLDKAARTPSGGAYRVPATVARTGIQLYRAADGSEIREYRPHNEVFRPETLDSLESATITRGHPGELVQADSWPSLTGGHVFKVDREPKKIQGEEYVASVLQVHRGDMLKDIDSGDLCEISLGYECELDFTPGVTPNGEKYDAIQKNIVINHVALLGKNDARAGREARIRLDGHQEHSYQARSDGPTIEETQMIKVKVDGVEYDKGSDAHVSALEKQANDQKTRADGLQTKVTEGETALATANAQRDTEKARADAAEAKLAPGAVALLVADELKFRARAAKVLGADYKFDAKTRKDVQLDALKKLGVTPAADASDTYVSAYFDARVDAVQEDHNVNEDEEPGTRNDADPYKALQAKRDAMRPSAGSN